MISLTSEFTDAKGRHARAWLFYDAQCDFCTRIARWIARPILRRGLGVAPLQDPRVVSLLGIPKHELLRAIRYLGPDGNLRVGADAVVALARELWWARPLVWISRIPRAMPFLTASYESLARRRRCYAQTSCGPAPNVSELLRRLL